MNTGIESELIDSAILKGLQAFAKSADFIKQLIDIFEAHGATSLSEIAQATQQSDWEALRQLVHRFKGSALNMGAKGLAELLRSIEKNLAANSLETELIEQLKQLPILYSETCKALKLII